jgi:hypothetical protein
MTNDEIAAARLRNQGLSIAPFADAAEVVRGLVAVQSQEYAVARWSIGQRARGVDEAAVERAIADGAILRTHVLRPTWHFVAREDLRWLMRLSAPRVHAVNAHYYRRAGLDDVRLARSNEVIARALEEGGRHLSRKELREALAREGIDGDGQRIAYLLMRAELDMVICSGAPRGKEQTYALFDERVPAGETLTPDEALAGLTRRYFASRGPATVKDYRWWSGLSAAQARRGLELAGSELERLTVGDRDYWLAPGEGGAGDAEPSPTVHLLQGYDECFIAYSESRGVLDTAGLFRAVVGRQMPFLHLFIVDGQFAGHWRRRVTAKSVAVEVQPSRELSAGERAALEREVESYGRFVGLPASLAG